MTNADWACLVSESLYYETLKAIREKNKIKFNDDTLKKAYNDYMNKLIESSKQTSKLWC